MRHAYKNHRCYEKLDNSSIETYAPNLDTDEYVLAHRSAIKNKIRPLKLNDDGDYIFPNEFSRGGKVITELCLLNSYVTYASKPIPPRFKSYHFAYYGGLMPAMDIPNLNNTRPEVVMRLLKSFAQDNLIEPLSRDQDFRDTWPAGATLRLESNIKPNLSFDSGELHLSVILGWKPRQKANCVTM